MDAAMVTLAGRSIGFTMIKKLKNGKEAKGVSDIVYRMLLPCKHEVKTITTDNGSEFAGHKRSAKLLDTKLYSAHPYCSWETD